MWADISLRFWLALSWWLMMEIIFSCVYWLSVYLPWEKMSIHVLCSFFNQIFKTLSYMNSLNIELYQIHCLQISFPLHWMAFSCFLCCAKAFWYHVVSFVYFCFCLPWLRRQIKKKIVLRWKMSKSVLTVFF